MEELSILGKTQDVSTMTIKVPPPSSWYSKVVHPVPGLGSPHDSDPMLLIGPETPCNATKQLPRTSPILSRTGRAR
jgi:hypothetical protein